MEQQQKRQTIQTDIDWEGTFEEYEHPAKEELIETIEANYSAFPTVIQCEAIDRYITYMSKKEKQAYFVQAPGGSGKTLCFTIPVVMEILKNYKQGEVLATFETKKIKGRDQEVFRYHPQIVVLCDTKTLQEQLGEEIAKSIPKDYKNKIQITQLSAGQTKKEQFGGFGQILITTPRMLTTFLESKQDNIFLDKCVLLAIDEAEHCHSNDPEAFPIFIQNIKDIKMANILSVSATLTDEYKNLIKEQFYGDKSNNGQNISQDLNLEGVTQYAIECKQGQFQDNQSWVYEQTIKLLSKLYRQKTESGQTQEAQVIIFFNEIKHLDLFNDYFLKAEIGSGSNKVSFNVIHGKMAIGPDGQVLKIESNKLIRENFKEFRKGGFKVLLTTNMMARGIDINKVGLVINIFCPRDLNNRDFKKQALSPHTFIHRIARTGRHKQQGVSLTFYRNDDYYEIPDNQIQEALSNKTKINSNTVHILQADDPEYIDTIAKKTESVVQFNIDLLEKKN